MVTWLCLCRVDVVDVGQQEVRASCWLLASVSGGELLLRSSSLCRSLPTVKINDAKP